MFSQSKDTSNRKAKLPIQTFKKRNTVVSTQVIAPNSINPIGDNNPPSYDCINAIAGNDVYIDCGGSTSIGNNIYSNNYDYAWSPNIRLSSTTEPNPVASPTQTTTYLLTMTPKPNFLSNGDFEYGNTGFYSDYTPDAGNFRYQSYTINNKASNVYPWWCSTDPPSKNKMLIVDGAVSNNKRVWYQTVNILPNKEYTFSGQFLNLYNTNGYNDPNIIFEINGSRLNFPKLLFNNCNDWTTLSMDWISGPDDYSATIAIYADPSVTNDGQGNDLAIDNLVFTAGSCPISTSKVTVYVNPSVIITPSHLDTICSYWEIAFQPILLTTNITSNIQWYRDGIAMPGETNNTFRITADAVGNGFFSSPSDTITLNHRLISHSYSVGSTNTTCISQPVSFTYIEYASYNIDPFPIPITRGVPLTITAAAYPNASYHWDMTFPGAIYLSSQDQRSITVQLPPQPYDIWARYPFCNLTISGADYSCINKTYTSIMPGEWTTPNIVKQLGISRAFLETINSSPTKEDPVIVYPNPAKNICHISSIEAFQKVQIHTARGELLLSSNTPGKFASIDISSLQSGSYFITIIASKRVTTKKIIVIK